MVSIGFYLLSLVFDRLDRIGKFRVHLFPSSVSFRVLCFHLGVKSFVVGYCNSNASRVFSFCAGGIIVNA